MNFDLLKAQCWRGFEGICGTHPVGELIKRQKTAVAPSGHCLCKAGAEQLPKLDRQHALAGYICKRITGQTMLPTPTPVLQGVG